MKSTEISVHKIKTNIRKSVFTIDLKFNKTACKESSLHSLFFEFNRSKRIKIYFNRFVGIDF